LEGKDFNEKSNVADLVQHAAEYCDLTDAEKAKLVTEFDVIKKVLVTVLQTQPLRHVLLNVVIVFSMSKKR
jgi:hypothetical protein